MNNNEKMGWVAMCLSIFMMSLPFIIPRVSNLEFIGYDKVIIVAIPLLVMFFIGLTKALPEVLIATFSSIEKPKTEKVE